MSVLELVIGGTLGVLATLWLQWLLSDIRPTIGHLRTEDRRKRAAARTVRARFSHRVEH